MYAVVEIAGQQFKVEKDQKLFVHRLENKEGSIVSFEKVYLIDDGKKISFGTPSISGTYVNAKVLKHLKGDKVIVFKKKRRKGYRVKNGHRQALTELLIQSIGKNTSTKKQVDSKKDLTKKVVVKKQPLKKPAVKKAVVKKAVVKKEPVKKGIAPKNKSSK
jgi:large subunit ribosomal protein L21|tara:strand:- start:167 stop:649 length:483 start_codon:yes stop_codon:yes gene_type:complete